MSKGIPLGLGGLRRPHGAAVAVLGGGMSFPWDVKDGMSVVDGMSTGSAIEVGNQVRIKHIANSAHHEELVGLAGIITAIHAEYSRGPSRRRRRNQLTSSRRNSWIFDVASW